MDAGGKLGSDTDPDTDNRSFISDHPKSAAFLFV
jgi:hypothetical protein